MDDVLLKDCKRALLKNKNRLQNKHKNKGYNNDNNFEMRDDVGEDNHNDFVTLLEMMERQLESSHSTLQFKVQLLFACFVMHV